MPTGYRIPTPPPGALNAAAAAATAAIGALGTGTILGWQITPPLSAYSGNPIAGQAQVTLTPPADGQAYRVERVQIGSNSSGTPSAYLQVGGYELDFTTAGTQHVFTEIPPIFVPSGATFTVLWVGLNPGDGVEAVIQYQVVAQ